LAIASSLTPILVAAHAVSVLQDRTINVRIGISSEKPYKGHIPNLSPFLPGIFLNFQMDLTSHPQQLRDLYTIQLGIH
jgi:hypothetical protein